MLHPLCVATWIFGSAYSILFLMFDYSTYELHCIATAATNSSLEMPLSASYLEGWKHPNQSLIYVHYNHDFCFLGSTVS